jgi:hypothetical protein
MLFFLAHIYTSIRISASLSSSQKFILKTPKFKLATDVWKWLIDMKDVLYVLIDLRSSRHGRMQSNLK